MKTGTVQGDWVRTANTGGASPFASQVTISAEGQHTVEYRSVDKAGNVEATKTVSFGIDIPDPGFPVIEAFADPTSGTAPLLVRFSATGFDPDGGALTYKWEFEDGAAFGRAVERTYTKPGTYTAKVTATDDEGDTTSKTVTVTVTEPGVPAADRRRARPASRAARRRCRSRSRPRATTPTVPTATCSYTWDFGDGGTLVRPEPDATSTCSRATFTAKVTVTRRRRRDGGQDVHDHGHQPAPATSPRRSRRRTPRTSQARRRPDEGHVHAPGHRPRRRRADATSGTSTTAARRRPASRSTTRYTQAGHVQRHGDREGPVGSDAHRHGEGRRAATRPATRTRSCRRRRTRRPGTSPLTVEFSSQASDPGGRGPDCTCWAFGDGQFGRRRARSIAHLHRGRHLHGDADGRPIRRAARARRRSRSS